MTDFTCAALVAAGGAGSRLGGPLPKQFLRLGDEPLLAHCLLALREVADGLAVVVPAGYVRFVWDEIIIPRKMTNVKKVVPGGADRQASVRLGIQAIDWPADVLLVHDGARPFVTADQARAVARAAWEYRAAALAVPAKDTIKLADGQGTSATTLPRDRLWQVQTPQGFQSDLIREAHRRAADDGFTATDDSALTERLGVPTRLVMGDYRNFKITTAEDLLLARTLALHPNGDLP